MLSLRTIRERVHLVAIALLAVLLLPLSSCLSVRAKFVWTATVRFLGTGFLGIYGWLESMFTGGPIISEIVHYAVRLLPSNLLGH
jgi:hypothetical protein